MAKTKTTAASMEGKKAPADKSDKRSNKLQRENEEKEKSSSTKYIKTTETNGISSTQYLEESSDDDTPLMNSRRRRGAQKSAALPTPTVSNERMTPEEVSDNNSEFAPLAEFAPARRALEESQRALEELVKCEAETAKHLSRKEDIIMELQTIYRNESLKSIRLGEELEAAKTSLARKTTDAEVLASEIEEHKEKATASDVELARLISATEKKIIQIVGLNAKVYQISTALQEIEKKLAEFKQQCDMTKALAKNQEDTIETISNDNARLKTYNEGLKKDISTKKKQLGLLKFVGGNALKKIDGYIKHSNSEMKALREKLAGVQTLKELTALQSDEARRHREFQQAEELSARH
ncbi:hypothetical protein ACEPPN_011058 [Leptodophora sp. 'Broadleaf-Isolate-01']